MKRIILVGFLVAPLEVPLKRLSRLNNALFPISVQTTKIVNHVFPKALPARSR
jgi:hypothetical protein